MNKPQLQSLLPTHLSMPPMTTYANAPESTNKKSPKRKPPSKKRRDYLRLQRYLHNKKPLSNAHFNHQPVIGSQSSPPTKKPSLIQNAQFSSPLPTYHPPQYYYLNHFPVNLPFLFPNNLVLVAIPQSNYPFFTGNLQATSTIPQYFVIDTSNYAGHPLVKYQQQYFADRQPLQNMTWGNRVGQFLRRADAEPAKTQQWANPPVKTTSEVNTQTENEVAYFELTDAWSRKQ